MHDQPAGKRDRSPHGEPTDIAAAVKGDNRDDPSDGHPDRHSVQENRQRLHDIVPPRRR
jgi:hypothetical protein